MGVLLCLFAIYNMYNICKLWNTDDAPLVRFLLVLVEWLIIGYSLAIYPDFATLSHAIAYKIF